MDSPFIYLDPVIPPYFAGRKVELDYINSSLFQEKESVVIYGNDAIGKSSIISTIYTDLNNSNRRSIFPVRINAFDFVKAVDTNFLGVVTHQICAAIWTKLMGRKYSQLIEDALLNTRGELFNKEEEKAIKRIFRIVSNEKFSGSGKLNKEAGGSFFVDGKITQDNELYIERKELAPFEFLHLLDELNDIIHSYHFNSIIVFCDELNHFPEKTNTDILRNYFSIFSSNKIQFVIIAVNPDTTKRNEAQKLIESFNCQLEIGTFKSDKEVEELIQNSINLINSEVVFNKGAAQLLFKLTDGHPWWIQKICDRAYSNAIKNNNSNISEEMIEKSYNEFEVELNIYKERILAGLPFRKYNLIR
jgi:Cdc6-like AAA superfamily ATPase